MFQTFEGAKDTAENANEADDVEEDEEEDVESHVWYPDVYHIGKRLLLQDNSKR